MQVKSHHFLTAYTGFCAEMAHAAARAHDRRRARREEGLAAAVQRMVFIDET
jgi:hypothetical protein